MSQKTEPKKIELPNIDILSTSKVEQIKISTKEILIVQINPKENQSNISNSLLLPKIKSNLDSLSDYFTPKTTNRDSPFFDINLTDLGNYTDIERILHEQSLILTMDNTQDKTETEVEQNQDLNLTNNQIELEINRNSIDFSINMANQALKLSLNDVAKLVPEFDGKNMTAEEYIEKLKQAKKIIANTDEQSLVQILKLKLKGEIYKALANIDIPNVKCLSNLYVIYPSTENIHSLYNSLTQIIQKPDEIVLEYANKIRQMGTKINKLKALEPNISTENLALFETLLEADILSSFIKGLKQEIRLELGEQANEHTAIQRGIEIELNLAKQNMLRSDTANILFNFEKTNSNSLEYLNVRSAKIEITRHYFVLR